MIPVWTTEPACPTARPPMPAPRFRVNTAKQDAESLSQLPEVGLPHLLGLEAASIMARMPALIAAGNVGQASMTACRSGSIWLKSDESALDFALSVCEIDDFPVFSVGVSSPLGGIYLSRLSPAAEITGNQHNPWLPVVCVACPLRLFRP